MSRATVPIPLDPDNDLDLPEYEIHIPQRKRKRNRKWRERSEVVVDLVEAGDDSQHGFNPTLNASKHERAWLLSYLGQFYEDQVIADVLHQVRGGKEANVYCCRAFPTMGVELLAAKVYRPRMFRNLRNDALYRQGREIIGEEGKEVRKRRELLAMRKGTEFGQKLRHATWLGNEYTTLQRLYSAGADVPRPFASSENAVLMEYIGDLKAAAPTLSQVRLNPKEARALFEQLMHNVELALDNDVIHADLSAFNVLYWHGKIQIIDWPQAINPYVNPRAKELLERDVQRLCQYFSRYGVTTDPIDLAHDFWNRHILHQQPGMLR